MTTGIDNPQREEILSPEETDALLQGIEDGSVQTSRGHGRPPGDVRLYDFSDCERLSRGSMPTLQIINTRIARELGVTLSELLRKPVEVELAAARTQRFGEHMSTLAMPASLNLVRLRPLAGTLLVVPANRLIYMTVDCFFGGTGAVPDDAPAREFTRVEQRMINLLLERIFAAMATGWKPVMPVAPELIGQEQNTDFAAIASSGDRVIVNEYSVKLNGQDASVQMIMPHALLEPIEPILDSAPRNDDARPDEQWVRGLRGQLEETAIGLHATLTQTVLRLGDVLDLRPGDVIPVELPDRIVLEAAGTPLYVGKIGASRNRNAIEITARVESNQSIIPEDDT